MKKLHFRDIKQVMNLISSCLQVLSKNPPEPGKKFHEWPNCPYMRTLLAIEERPAFLHIMRYISSRINCETFSSQSSNWPYLTKSLGVFIQRVSSCAKIIEEESDPEEFNFKRLVSCELNELVKLLNVIELNLEFAAPEVVRDLFLYIQPAYQEIHNIPDSILADQGDVPEGSVIPLIQSIDSLMDFFFKKAEFPEEPEVPHQIKVAQIMVWILSGRMNFRNFHDAVDENVRKILENGILEGLKLIQNAARTEVEDTLQNSDAFPNRNLELFKLFVALILKNMNEKVDDNTDDMIKFSDSEIDEINEIILGLFQLCQELFPSFESTQMATFDLLISKLRRQYSQILGTKAGFPFFLTCKHMMFILRVKTGNLSQQFTSQLFTTPTKPKKRIVTLEQISSILSRSNVEANLEFQNLLDHSRELYTKKITTSAVARITKRLKEMAKLENWSQNAVQLILPYLNLIVYKSETDHQFDIYPITSNGKSSFIVGVKGTNYSQMSQLIPHLVDSPLAHTLRANLTDKPFLKVYSESVQQLSKIICKSTSITSKVTERDSTVQFLMAPVLHGGASLDDSLLQALKRFAPEGKLGKLTSFVPEFCNNIDNVPPKQLAKLARFVYRAEPELFKKILGSLFAKAGFHIDDFSSASDWLTFKKSAIWSPSI